MSWQPVPRTGLSHLACIANGLLCLPQGMTITERAIVHVRDAFACAIVYVMLSRVRSRVNLLVVGQLQPKDFTPIPNIAMADSPAGDVLMADAPAAAGP